ncbi:hypothetical protein [Algoriphagus faecimaris]|uniref:hypothetical protein n=1 Tax=Algoriphagus faecimaris TaxID=686796 RepID=UPI0011139456|nr:hypothetical protein [Algoriphagus faecimaris]
MNSLFIRSGYSLTWAENKTYLADLCFDRRFSSLRSSEFEIPRYYRRIFNPKTLEPLRFLSSKILFSATHAFFIPGLKPEAIHLAVPTFAATQAYGIMIRFIE